MRVAVRTLALALLALSAGCYTYVPVAPEAVSPGVRIQVQLNDEGMEEMRRYVGPDVLTIEGPLVSTEGGTLSVLRTGYLRRDGFPATTVVDTIAIAPQYLLDVGVRKLHSGKTAAFTIGAVAAAVTTVFAALVSGGGPDEGGEGTVDPPDDAIILRIPLWIGR